MPRRAGLVSPAATGAVAQLGERQNGILEVVGSSPISSTLFPMSRPSQSRHSAIVALCPTEGFVVDVGADHGHVAHRLGAIATERQPHRRGRTDVAWVVADGLKPFRHVDVAVIAGMGALRIVEILSAAPKPRAVVLHATDDPAHLRQRIVELGWRIDAEAVVREGKRFAEIIRASPGIETADPIAVALGPHLLRLRTPIVRAHFERLAAHLRGTAERKRPHDPVTAATLIRRADKLDWWLCCDAALPKDAS